MRKRFFKRATGLLLSIAIFGTSIFSVLCSAKVSESQQNTETFESQINTIEPTLSKLDEIQLEESQSDAIEMEYKLIDADKDDTLQAEYSKKYENFVSDKRFKLKLNLLGEYGFIAPDREYDDELACELFPKGLPQVDDIIQGGMGICYYLAAISSIVNKNPQIIKDAMTDNNDGTVTVRVYDIATAKPRYITVQKTIPNLPYNKRILGKECLWVHLLLKGLIAAGFTTYAGTHIVNTMNYRDTNGGFMREVMEMITGKKCCKYRSLLNLRCRYNEEKIYNIIKNSLDNGSGIMTCSFNNFFATLAVVYLGVYNNKGLVATHAYSVMDAYEDKDGQKWVVIRNP